MSKTKQNVIVGILVFGGFILLFVGQSLFFGDKIYEKAHH